MEAINVQEVSCSLGLYAWGLVVATLQAAGLDEIMEELDYQIQEATAVDDEVSP